MRSRICKLLTLVLLVSTLMTGCDKLDYRKAVQLYNNRQYDKAIELFHALGDYEDSADLFTDSHYWAAMERMEAGNYAEAWPRFHKLGDYKDSADRAIECKYQMAIDALEAEEYDTAERYFLEAPDYRKTADYLRQLEWQKLYEYILANGTESGSYVITYPLPDRTVAFMADVAMPTQIQMISSWEKVVGYIFRDSLTLVLERDSTAAAFEASSEFTMDFDGGTIGSQQTGTGTVDLHSYALGTALTYDSFFLSVTDNHGNTTTSEDPVNSSMDAAMADHLAAILDCFSALQVVAETNYIF